MVYVNVVITANGKIVNLGDLTLVNTQFALGMNERGRVRRGNGKGEEEGGRIEADYSLVFHRFKEESEHGDIGELRDYRRAGNGCLGWSV